MIRKRIPMRIAVKVMQAARHQKVTPAHLSTARRERFPEPGTLIIPFPVKSPPIPDCLTDWNG